MLYWKKLPQGSVEPKDTEETSLLTYEQVTQSQAIRTYITRADESLAALGYT